MNTRKTFGVVFYQRRYKANKGEAPLYARITVNGQRVDLSLKQSIAPCNWDGKKGLAKGSREEVYAVNLYLEQVRSKLVKHYQELVLHDKVATAEVVKNKFLGLDEQEQTLCQLVEYHNTQMLDVLAWGTMKNYFTTQKYLNLFLKKKHCSDVYLREVTYKFVIDFEYFLRSYKPLDHHKPLGNNGVMKHMERFRKMINLAIRMEWIKHDPFAKYQSKFDKVTREFLSADELAVIEQREFPIGRLQLVRDLFIFSCYTGLAYIDVMQLTPANINIGIDGSQWLTTNRQKTSTPVRVPLLAQAQEIVTKYKGDLRANAKGLVFPAISNQKLNSYLKEIADLCGIEKNLTFHLARHTFATTVTLTNGVPIETVSKMLGHTSIRTTQIYAKVQETKISQDMQTLKEKLAKAAKGQKAVRGQRAGE